MTAYVVALVKVTDDTWIPSNAAAGAQVIARHGGRYISRSAIRANWARPTKS